MKGLKEFIWMRLEMNSAIEMSFIEPGEHIYAFLDYWPKNPITIEITKDTEMADILLKKKVLSSNLKQEHNCQMYGQTSYEGNNLHNTGRR